MYSSDIPETASKAVRRQASNEWALSYETLDAVFKAKETTHLKILLEERIYDNPDYQGLPKFRKIALQAYFRGVCDALARVAGVQTPAIATEKPKSAPPKKTRKTKIAPPAIKPSKGGIRTPLPDWVTEQPELLHKPGTILPPSPFPPAADLGMSYG